MATGESPVRPPGGLATTTFFSRTYDEAYALLREARDYVSAAEVIAWNKPLVGLVHTQEALRVTARLGHIMAWLLIQRAVHAGEISREESRHESHRISSHPACLDAGGEGVAQLPVELRDLLVRSRKLYQRVMRLDEMVTRDTD